MKILMVTRLFSGLEDCIGSEEWIPKGIPTIYKIVEQLDQDKDVDLDVVYACKNEPRVGFPGKIRKIKLTPLKSDFYILPFFSGIAFPFKWLCKLSYRGRVFNELHQSLHILRLIMKKDYDLIYIDRMHIGVGAISVNLLKKKVILRLLGVYKSMHIMSDARKNPLNWLTRKCYMALYNYVICTQDGSGGEQFIEKMIHKDIPSEILFNGVDLGSIDQNYIKSVKNDFGINQELPVFIFIGKLVDYKGCREFVNSLIALNEINKNFYAILVGEGNLKKELQEKVRDAGLDRKIFFSGLVKHELVINYLEMSDVYVTLNSEGSLSNTVLEAIKNGKCVIRLTSSEENYKDLYTDDILEEKYTPRVDRDKIEEQLPAILANLAENPLKIKACSKEMRKIADEYLWDWEKRIEYEINIIKETALSKI